MNKLIFLDLKRKKKSWRLLMSVLILNYAFIVIISTFYASMDRTAEFRRESAYGSWHVALIGADKDTINDLKSHVTIDTAGISSIYGMVLDKNNKDLARIGTADKNTRTMENIDLLDGHFPEYKGEIAIEMSSLNAMGYSSELGQNIKVPARVNLGKVNKDVILEYTLVGIVQDYSTKLKGTTPDKRDYVSFFVSDSDDVIKYKSIVNYVCRLKKEFGENDKELLKIKGKSATVLTNNYTYYEFGKESSYQVILSKVQRWLVLTASIIILMFVSCALLINYRKEQRDNFNLLCQIGRKKNYINILMVKEVTLINFITLCIGFCIGSVVAFILSNIVSLLKIDLQILYPIKTIVIWEATAAIFIGVANIICVFKPMKQKIRSKKKYRKKYSYNEKEYKMVKRVYKRKLLNEIKVNWRYTFFVFLILCISTFQVNEKRVITERLEGGQVPDFIHGILYNYYPFNMGIEAELCKQAEKAYGVRSIETFKSNNYLTVNWDGMEKSQYVNNLKDSYWPVYANTTEPQVFVFGIAPKGEAFDYYTQNMTKGNIDKEKFEKGEMVILYVPNYDLDSNGDFKTAPNGKQHEDTIKVGEIFKIEGEAGINNVEIGGIINNFKQGDFKGEITRPLSIIGSYTLCDRLAGQEDNLYKYLAVSAFKNINYEQITAEMLNISKIITNNLENKQRYKFNYYSSLSIYTLVDLTCISFMVIGGWNKKYLSRYKNKRLNILRNLGTSKMDYYFYNFKSSIVSSCLGAVTGSITSIVLLTIIYSLGFNIYSNLKVFETARSSALYVCNKIPVKMWGAICLIYIVISCLFTYINAKKSLKKLEM